MTLPFPLVARRALVWRDRSDRAAIDLRAAVGIGSAMRAVAAASAGWGALPCRPAVLLMLVASLVGNGCNHEGGRTCGC